MSVFSLTTVVAYAEDNSQGTWKYLSFRQTQSLMTLVVIFCKQQAFPLLGRMSFRQDKHSISCHDQSRTHLMMLSDV